MNQANDINSNRYWDQRFVTDWESNGGPAQSRFFAQVAIESMPQWLVQAVRWNRLSVCDWGCAEGAGTEAIAQVLGWDVTGIDFSGPAIEQAKLHHTHARFSHENLLESPERPAFDVVFSSNTLEHFSTPWSVFDKLTRYASTYIVLLLPFREFERHSEHEVTFDSNNIPVSPDPRWALVHSSVTDTSQHQPTYWPGKQILLVYARVEHLAKTRFALADAELGEPDRHELITELRAELDSLQSKQASTQQLLETAQSRLESENKTRLTLEVEHTQTLARFETLQQTLQTTSAKDSERIRFLEYREKALIHEVNTILATTSWKITAPLRAVRGAPRWIARRMKDVEHAYAHGGLSNVISRALGYFPKRFAGKHPASTPVTAIASLGSSAAKLPPVQFTPVARREKADVFVFSIIDWHFRIQRPQHLARELARAGHRVYFFTNHFEDSKEPGFTAERIDESLPLYQIKLKVAGAPAIYFAPPTQAAIEQIAAGLEMFRAWSGTSNTWSVVQHAYWYPIAQRMQSECLAYDCMDHHEGFGNVPQELLQLEDRMMRRADMLIATSGWLGEHAEKYNANVRIIRNAGQYSDFCNAPAERYVDAQGRKIIGYYGAIAEWFDVDLIERTAHAFPDHLVLLVGADTAKVGDRLRALPNVVMTGEVPYAKLPFYLYAFDICLMPFKVIPLTLATHPVKVYEYLGAGRSVVSVDLPEMAQFGDLVRVATGHDAFIEQVRNALMAQPDSDAEIERRKAFAAGQTWAHRVQSLREAAIALPRPKVSAIVLTYNNLDLTKACLDSLEQHSDDVDLEIVVVDNKSTDGSPEFLSAWAASRTNVKLILNDDNRGFAGGNNQGLEAATGDYLVIQNNDTVVTQGWAGRLVNHLRNAPEIGIIGPSTNNIGNEARVPTHYKTLADMPAEAVNITERRLGKRFELQTVAFFCTMLPRSTYEKCGPMSLDYGLGFFEDDDYCRMVEQAGLKVVCAEDVFVHHHLSASFNKLGDERKRALMEKNRAIYEAKWGPWKPHEYRKH